jgi:Concanavalin A-like lectin/glucanases superfamily
MFVIQRPWSAQPPVGTRMATNALTSRITNLLPLNGDPRDILSGKLLTVNAGASYTASSLGLAITGSGALSVASIPLNLSASPLLTMSFWLYWDAFANDDDLALELTTSSGNAGAITVNPNDSFAAGGGQFTVATAQSGGFKYGYLTRPSAQAWHHYFFTFDRTAPAGQLGITGFVDGAPVAVNNLISDTLSGNFADDILYVLSRNNAALFGAGKICNLVFRSGYIGGAAEALAEFVYPWTLFAPRRIYIPAGAAIVNPTLTAAQAFNITTSSAQARVTFTRP